MENNDYAKYPMGQPVQQQPQMPLNYPQYPENYQMAGNMVPPPPYMMQQQLVSPNQSKEIQILNKYFQSLLRQISLYIHQISCPLMKQEKLAYDIIFKNLVKDLNSQFIINKSTLSKLQLSSQNSTWLMALFFLFCLPCIVWLPFCLNNMKDVVHHCPNCKQFLGRRKYLCDD